ncbi:Fc.00g116090.m01.CDS01 [Cosmosporella sp. VM-42]
MGSYQTFRLVPIQNEVLDERDDWTALDDAQERRKRQNRLNQRAARRRQRLNEERRDGSNAKPTRVVHPSHSSNGSSQVASGSCIGPVVPSCQSADLYFPLTPDHHLLHVVSLNVTRAILTNYSIICSIPLPTTSFCSVRRIFKLPAPHDILSGHNTIADTTALNSLLPPSLMPTQLQQQVPHLGWVDLFPSPQLRDNLILALETCQIDEDDFVMDLMGDVYDSLCCTGENEGGDPEQSDSRNIDSVYFTTQMDPRVTTTDNGTPTRPPDSGNSWTGEPGLLSWSDPWEISGWELTERFAKKWGYLLQSCPDVITAANKWRMIRGEQPLVVEV